MFRSILNRPFAVLTFTTSAGTFRWTQSRAGEHFACELKVGRGWVREHRLDAVNAEHLGWHLRDLMSN